MAINRTYNVICQSVVGNTNAGFSTVYAMDERRFDYRQDAIDHGFTLGRSDDFNIGVWHDGKLVSLDWMGEPVDTDPDLLLKIQNDREVV